VCEGITKKHYQNAGAPAKPSSSPVLPERFAEASAWIKDKVSSTLAFSPTFDAYSAQYNVASSQGGKYTSESSTKQNPSHHNFHLLFSPLLLETLIGFPFPLFPNSKERRNLLLLSLPRLLLYYCSM